MKVNDRDWSVTDTVTSPKEYIEKDDFYDVIDGGFDLNFDELPESKAALLEMIRNFDPADVKPVVRGEWIEGEYVGEVGDEIKWHCSSCGFAVLSDEHPAWRFCPDCGADMRKEAKDER